MFDSAMLLNWCNSFLHALFMLQAMAALASSKEADWNAMRLRLAHNMSTTISSLRSFLYCSFGRAALFAAQYENKASRILIELDDQKVACKLEENLIGI